MKIASFFEKFIKKIRIGRSKTAFDIGSRAKRDWKIILAAFVTIAIVILSLNYYYVYKRAQDHSLSLSEKINGASNLLDQKMLDQTIQSFQERKKIFSSIGDEAAPADPAER